MQTTNFQSDYKFLMDKPVFKPIYDEVKFTQFDVKYFLYTPTGIRLKNTLYLIGVSLNFRTRSLFNNTR